MSHNSRNRDIYYTKLKNATGGEAEGMLRGLMVSPHRQHKSRAERILNNAGRIAEALSKAQVKEAPDAEA